MPAIYCETKKQSLKRYLFALVVFIFLIQSAPNFASPTAIDLVKAAHERTTLQVRYDGSYHRIPYPNGDVPANIGVCTDVVIRSYRPLGIDLQELLHLDMQNNFDAYPSKRIWNLDKPDSNIDHRRVPNLAAFFSRFGEILKVSNNNADYKAGDIVTWTLPGNLPHIGIVSDRINADTGRAMIIHNIGAGPKLQDMIFDYKISGHYRYFPEIE